MQKHNCLPVLEPSLVVIESNALWHASHDVDHILLIHWHLEAAA